MGALLMGRFVEMKDSVLGWKIRENVNHDMIMMESQGLGFSWGMSLRRGVPLFI